MMSYTRIPTIETGFIRDTRKGSNPLSMINDHSLSEADKVRVNVRMFNNQMRIFFKLSPFSLYVIVYTQLDSIKNSSAYTC